MNTTTTPPVFSHPVREQRPKFVRLVFSTGEFALFAGAARHRRLALDILAKQALTALASTTIRDRLAGQHRVPPDVLALLTEIQRQPLPPPVFKGEKNDLLIQRQHGEVTFHLLLSDAEYAVMNWARFKHIPATLPAFARTAIHQFLFDETPTKQNQ